MIELWMPVPYKPYNKRYSISNKGRVRVDSVSKFSKNKTKYLKHGIGARGYPCVTLYFGGSHKQAFVHRMVALSFIEQQSGKDLVCHIDDNKLNNHASNLIWGSSADNMRMMVEHGRSIRGESVNTAKLTAEQVFEIRTLYKEGDISQTELAAIFGVDQTQISRIVLGQAWKHITT